MRPAESQLKDQHIASLGHGVGQFTPDVAGEYLLKVTVDDRDEVDIDQVMVTAKDNMPPVANAGPDIPEALVGQVVELDGPASGDPENGPEPLSCIWSFVIRPTESGLTAADLVSSELDPYVVRFTPDVAGAYLLKVTVSDGEASDMDEVMVTVQ